MYAHGSVGHPLIWVMLGMFWLALIVVIVWIIVQLATGKTRPLRMGRLSPQEILDQRLARGEVDPETYRASRAALLETAAALSRASAPATKAPPAPANPPVPAPPPDPGTPSSQVPTGEGSK